MLYSSSRYHLDAVLFVLCAIAGASSRKSLNASHNRNTFSQPTLKQYRASFIDSLLDDSFIELLNSSSSNNKIDHHHHHHQQPLMNNFNETKTTTNESAAQGAKNQPYQQTICGLVANLLNGNQLKFCHQHLEVLEIILPQVMQITRRECRRISADLRWNCSSIAVLLDKSNPVAFTREAALVRSILNAAMMYLVVKTCSENRSQRSCGCQNNYQSSSSHIVDVDHVDYINSIGGGVSQAKRASATVSANQQASGEEELDNRVVVGDAHEVSSSLDFVDDGQLFQDLSPADLSKLDSGSPLRLPPKPTVVRRRQGCLANTAFAEAFTRLFIDSDDTKALNRAYKILNDNAAHQQQQQPLHRHGITSRRSSKLDTMSSFRRLIDPDNKDLAYIKWTKSAINLHNNHLGRQMVRSAVQRKCRCHGLSGVCPLQTCWDQLVEFETITARLRSIYLANVTKAEVKNVGSPERPDLRLFRLADSSSSSNSSAPSSSMLNAPSEDLRNLFASQIGLSGELDGEQLLSSSRVRAGELIYLYESPEYCEPIPRIGHSGTKGRPCELASTIKNQTNEALIDQAAPVCLQASKVGDVTTGTSPEEDANQQHRQRRRRNPGELMPGSCEYLCCNRGCRSELILDMVSCNCRFEFCCKLECDHCLRQRVQHYCL